MVVAAVHGLLERSWAIVSSASAVAAVASAAVTAVSASELQAF